MRIAILCGLAIALIDPARDGYASIALTSIAPSYTQNFNTLVDSGTSGTPPANWYFSETGPGADATYGADDGGSIVGNTYSYGGGADPTDRAFGTLRSGIISQFISTIGAEFSNGGTAEIVALSISYRGEEWRLGFVDDVEPRTDRLDFEYSLTATSLSSPNWVGVDALDFSTPTITGIAGAKDGNAAGFNTAVSSSITNLSIAPSATFWIRWTDFNAVASDDGLAVDDFNITAVYAAVPEPSALLFGGLVCGVMALAMGVRRALAKRPGLVSRANRQI